MTKFVAFYQTLDDGIKRQSEIESDTLEQVEVIFRNAYPNCVLNEIGVPYDSRYMCDND
jgi:hypothetical protein